MRHYVINIYGNEDGSFRVEFLNPNYDANASERLFTAFIVWGLNVIRATPALMRAAGFQEVR